MAEPQYVIPDADEVIAGRGEAHIDIIVKRNGDPLDLSGMTATATLRLADSPGTPIDDSLEDVPLVIVSAPVGSTRLDLDDDQLQLLQKKWEPVNKIRVQVKVPEIPFYPTPFHLYVAYTPD